MTKKENKISDNKEEKQKLSSYKGVLASVFNRIKANSKRREISFNLSIIEIGDLFEKQKGHCAISSSLLILKKDLNDTTSNASLDRIDSSKGYSIKNVQWVDKEINRMKGSMSTKEFIEYCKLVVLSKKPLN